MSHISLIKTKIVEKEFLLRALQDLGYSFEEGADLTVQGFGHKSEAVEIRIPTRLGWEIGFRKHGEVYEVVADWIGVGGKIQRKEFIQQVTQRYAYHVTRAKLEAQGFSMISEEVQEKGKDKGQIRLVLRRMD
jgi:hypothetical protein